jgi:ABC-2 type transport system ATP-binding protein
MSLLQIDPTTQFRLKKIIKELAADPNVTIYRAMIYYTVEVSDRIVAMHKGEVVKTFKLHQKHYKIRAVFAV